MLVITTQFVYFLKGVNKTDLPMQGIGGSIVRRVEWGIVDPKTGQVPWYLEKTGTLTYVKVGEHMKIDKMEIGPVVAILD